MINILSQKLSRIIKKQYYISKKHHSLILLEILFQKVFFSKTSFFELETHFKGGECQLATIAEQPCIVQKIK